jgi:phosphoadenosine phosphosulfate reductase
MSNHFIFPTELQTNDLNTPDLRVTDLKARAEMLGRRYRDADASELLRGIIEDESPGRTAVLSSFGAESALLLAVVAEIDASIPVIFLDTGKIFPETLEYISAVETRLGLTDVRRVAPSAGALASRDPEGALWQFDPDACCALRKVEPMLAALTGIDALISGRKRYHGALRHFIPRIEAGEGVIKIDPIADWSRERVSAEFTLRALPRHPLEALGYPSIGCAPCTLPAGAGEDMRAGRWSGLAKTECGIHAPRLSPNAIAS